MSQTIQHPVSRAAISQPQKAIVPAKMGLLDRVKKALGEAFSTPESPKETISSRDKYIRGATMSRAAAGYLGRVTGGQATPAAASGAVPDAHLIAYLNHISLTGDPSIASMTPQNSNVPPSRKVA